MTYLTLNYPNLAEGAEVEIDGLGIFVNRETAEVSSDDEAAFRHRLGKPVEVTAPDPEDESDHPKEIVVGAIFQQGPTLVQYFKDDPNVTASRTAPVEEPEPEEPTPVQPKPQASSTPMAIAKDTTTGEDKEVTKND